MGIIRRLIIEAHTSNPDERPAGSASDLFSAKKNCARTIDRSGAGSKPYRGGPPIVGGKVAILFVSQKTFIVFVANADWIAECVSGTRLRTSRKFHGHRY